MPNYYRLITLLITLSFSSQAVSQNSTEQIDSFLIYHKLVESQYQIEYTEFETILSKMQLFGDIHKFVIERIDETRRTPIDHEYYPAFLNFLCNNMDSIYREEIIDLINKDSIGRHIAYPIVKYCLFKTSEETCEYLEYQNPEAKYIESKSLLYESLWKLQKEMNCSQ